LCTQIEIGEQQLTILRAASEYNLSVNNFPCKFCGNHPLQTVRILDNGMVFVLESCTSGLRVFLQSLLCIGTQVILVRGTCLVLHISRLPPRRYLRMKTSLLPLTIYGRTTRYSHSVTSGMCYVSQYSIRGKEIKHMKEICSMPVRQPDAPEEHLVFRS
jgi:hypothetical protein